MEKPSTAHTPKYKRVTQDQIVTMLQLRKVGKTQPEIAQALGCDQGTVSRTLKQFTDTTAEATTYLRGKALTMAKHIVQKGQPRDHVAALKGLNVLEPDDRQTQIAIGISLPGLSLASATTVSSPATGSLELSPVSD